jgi:Na+/glutamate symporter
MLNPPLYIMAKIVGIVFRNICKYFKLSKILSTSNETYTFRAILLQAWMGPEGSRGLRITDL